MEMNRPREVICEADEGRISYCVWMFILLYFGQ